MLAVLPVLFWAVPLLAQDPLALKGFQHFYNLEYDQSIAEFEKEVAARPNSPDLHNHLAQAIQFRELYRVGALESELVSGNNSFLRRPKIDTTKAIEDRFLAELNLAMSLAQALLNKNQNDAKALYSMGVSYGLRANWKFLVRKAWRDALNDATTSRKLHNRISEIEPDNWDARLTQGIHDYILGSLPFGYKMLGFLIGFRGDREKGIRTLQEVAVKGRLNRIDAQVFLCALYRREEKWQQAGPLLADLVRRFPSNYLLRFEQAQMYGALGQRDQAIAAIDQVASIKRSGGLPSLSMEKIHYQLGNLLFWYREYNTSLDHLQRVTESLDAVDLNTGTLAWMRTGQIYDLTNRRTQALEAYRKAIAFAPEAEAARESRRYLSSPYKRS